ncbi:MAG: sodium:solute symporter family protein [Planctomycetota bacterium]|jgi:SSS family solute:Na+ symporter
MNMHTIDWLIVIGLLVVLVTGAVRTQRYTRSVSAFLAADRCGGRYLISVAQGAAMVGVISIVWFFEQNYKVGFTPYWWGLLEGPAMIVMALSGWVIYRFRQTRAMTLAQFFEIRYSRPFRVFAGLVAFLAGIVNFGIFPAVGARFFIAMCGLPEQFAVAGVELSTFPTVMVLLLAVSLTFVFLGGQIAVMVTDFIQGIVSNLVFAAVIVFLLLTFSWEQVSEVLLAAPPSESLVNPFDIGDESHFNIWYYVIGVVIIFYGAMSWQGPAGYQCAAKNAHEAKMAGILGGWRPRVLMLVVLVLPICVRTMLHHPDFAGQAAEVHASLDALESDTLRHQLRTPYAIGALLPAGLLGLTCAAMLALFISTHDTYLHSWGSILVQDVILPFRKEPFSPRVHLWLLRGSIFAVAVFIFVFSVLYEPKQYVAMFLALTGAIFFGGAGSAIIGGLYWSRGTTAGAWAAMITGMTLSSAGIVLKQYDVPMPEWLTGQVLTFVAIACSVGAYIGVSLLGPRAVFDMDRMLHRGEHAMEGESSASIGDAQTIMEKLGFSRDFTGRDKLITYVTLGWPLAWTVIFVLGTVYNLVVDVPDESWLAFWRWFTWFILACSLVVTVWFTIGGTKDLRDLFRRLRRSHANVLDDGRVVDHHMADEENDAS